jgi:hypothetical protein
MQFQPGQSGNPAGRPPGARNRATLVAEALFDGEIETIVRAAIDKAVGGNMQAVSLCLDRVAPRRRDSAIAFALPPIERPADAVTAMAAIVAALAEGDLSPAEADALSRVVDRYLRALETATFEERLTKLEQNPKD